MLMPASLAIVSLNVRKGEECFRIAAYEVALSSEKCTEKNIRDRRRPLTVISGIRNAGCQQIMVMVVAEQRPVVVVHDIEYRTRTANPLVADSADFPGPRAL